MGVRVRWLVLLGGALMLPDPARADIYLTRDKLGVIHLTNVPTGPARVVIKEWPTRRLPPPRILPTTPNPARGTFSIVRAAPFARSSRYFRPALLSSRSLGPTQFDPIIREMAERYNVEYALVKAVIKAESGFDHLAISPKGALGLMQLMPQTAAQHQVRNAFQPRDNIEGGTRHLRMLLDRYGGNVSLSVAAYNAGAQRVEDAGGVPAITETREYLTRVLRYRLLYQREAPGVVTARR